MTDEQQVTQPTFQLPEGVTMETLLSKYGEIEEALDAINAQAKAAAGPLEEAKKAIVGTVHKFMLSTGQQNASAAGRVAFFTTVDYVKVQDWQRMLRFMLSTAIQRVYQIPAEQADQVADALINTGVFALLKKDVAKAAAKEYMAENGDQPPPGVGYTMSKELRIQKR